MGGLDGIGDVGMFASALARPQNLHAYDGDKIDLLALDAAYAFGIARNHPFLDGNKRAACVVCRTFLLLDGLYLKCSAEERYATFLALAA
jgi:death-on-curing protein